MNVCQFWHYLDEIENYLLKILEILKNIKKFKNFLKKFIIQEKLHTIFHNNEGNNENTNEFIWKLMTILNFLVHVNLKSVFIFYLIQQ